MRARVCVLAAVAPRLKIVVKERRSVLRNLMGCAVLGIFKGYDKRARLSINLDYGVLSGSLGFNHSTPQIALDIPKKLMIRSFTSCGATAGRGRLRRDPGRMSA